MNLAMALVASLDSVRMRLAVTATLAEVGDIKGS